MVTILELFALSVLWSCVVELVDPQGESAIFGAARQWVEANRPNIVDIDNEL
jgi:hypothetical protein